ncbi:hypothetical protein TNIN_80831 [Trichonephila inaurata madagascariensis]|uniref:Uncharacterized protein n=1 Tax=Trichonephila inaurata madagascariensis TaxID=2747483 RepID=A0A8X6YEU4_9ARAC|nr:hypothetical protein TNIN_80831 [Trichonephila inaurata madagascariensis]
MRSESFNDGRQVSSRKPDRLPKREYSHPVPMRDPFKMLWLWETREGNRTLLGTDFLSSAGLVVDVKNTCWNFWDNPTHKHPFGEELDTLSVD